MTKKKKATEPTAGTTTTASQLEDRFTKLLKEGRSMDDIERISKYANLESEFSSWKQNYENTKQKPELDL